MTQSFQTEETIRNPRKAHRCIHCGGTIPAGVAHVKSAGVWDGDFYSHRAHHDCHELWHEAFPIYGDAWDGMALDLCEAIGGDEGREIVQHEYDLWRGKYPHVICRLELRWQRGDIKCRDRYRSMGFEPDTEDCPEVYA